MAARGTAVLFAVAVVVVGYEGVMAHAARPPARRPTTAPLNNNSVIAAPFFTPRTAPRREPRHTSCRPILGLLPLHRWR
jgi:hypothetical protein